MKKVTGIGGIFIKSKDTAATAAWYEQHLGIRKGPYGTVFAWRPFNNPDAPACTMWSLFKDTTDYFNPSSQEFMINYRVENLEALLAELREAGVTIAGDMQTYDYGKFGWIIDPEGRKIELWEPIDTSFSDGFQDHAVY